MPASAFLLKDVEPDELREAVGVVAEGEAPPSRRASPGG
jgi:hypothetical protein